jgi:hypothetical protein
VGRTRGFGGPRFFSCSWKYILSTWNNWKIIGFVCCVVRNRIGWVGRLENFWRSERKEEKKKVWWMELKLFPRKREWAMHSSSSCR